MAVVLELLDRSGTRQDLDADPWIWLGCFASLYGGFELVSPVSSLLAWLCAELSRSATTPSSPLASSSVFSRLVACPYSVSSQQNGTNDPSSPSASPTGTPQTVSPPSSLQSSLSACKFSFGPQNIADYRHQCPRPERPHRILAIDSSSWSAS